MDHTEVAAFLGDTPFARQIARALARDEGITTVARLQEEFNRPIPMPGMQRGWAIVDARGVGPKALALIAERLDQGAVAAPTAEGEDA
jgi:hypothetical protein